MAGIHIQVFTEGHVIHGVINTGGERLTDILNNHNQSSITLREVEIARLFRLAQESPMRLDNACIEKTSILFAMPVERDLTEKSIFRKATRQLFLITVLLHNFEIMGRIHMPERMSINRMLIVRPEDFIPLTDARATYVPKPEITFPSEMLIFNKARVSLLGENFPTQATTKQP